MPALPLQSTFASSEYQDIIAYLNKMGPENKRVRAPFLVIMSVLMMNSRRFRRTNGNGRHPMFDLTG